MSTTGDPVISIDLAFQAAPSDLMDAEADAQLQERLNTQDAWELDLITWLTAMRSDASLDCPEVVQTATEFSLGLQFCDDPTIAALNGQWRQKPQPTDVLSFPALEGDPPIGADACLELGDIIVSVPTAQRQADEHGHDLLHELRWLVSHGFLHLLGWDHPDDAQLNAMLQCQERLLAINGKVQSQGEIS